MLHDWIGSIAKKNKKHNFTSFNEIGDNKDTFNNIRWLVYFSFRIAI